MNNQFIRLARTLNDYLDEKKVFVKNPARFADVERATEIAAELFSDMKISINDDPLQMGALILAIEGFDVTARGQREIDLFTELVSKADNFEIYPVGDESLKFSILFNGALTRVR